MITARSSGGVLCGRIENTIQNSVKRTYTSGESKLGVEETIQNGVKSISFLKSRFPDDIDNAIKKGKKID